MESLNIYTSDGDSDFSPCKVIARKFAGKSEEVGANCEPSTMDVSEDSSNEHSDHRINERSNALKTKRHYSKSLSTSPATSYSSDSSYSNKRSKIRDVDSKTDSSKNKRYNEDRRDDDRRSKYDRDYRREDDDRDRRRRNNGRDRRRNREGDRYAIEKYDKKRHRSRSRSPSRSGHKSYRSKKSRSRSRSHDRYHRRGSPNRTSSRRRSPYRSRRSRSRSKSRDKPKPKNWKSTSKLKVLEKLGIELKVPPMAVEAPVAGSNQTNSNISNQLTPQMLLQKTMEEQVEKVKSATGIALPSYYNPMAVNPTKYAEQLQKRRLLWGNKEKQTQDAPLQEKKTIITAPVTAAPSADGKGGGTIWQGAKFGGDQDGKLTAKFQRLMGIKNPNAAPVPETKKEGTDLIKKQEELFNSMESQYEVARMVTHTHRGVGLGFGTFQPK